MLDIRVIAAEGERVDQEQFVAACPRRTRAAARLARPRWRRAAGRRCRDATWNSRPSVSRAVAVSPPRSRRYPLPPEQHRTALSPSPWRKTSLRACAALRRQSSWTCQGEYGSALADCIGGGLRLLPQHDRERGDEISFGRRLARCAETEPPRSRSIRPVSRSALANDGDADQARQKLDVVGRRRRSGTAPAPRACAPAPRAGLVPDDQLGDHRVVVRRDRVALLDAGVDAHVLGFRRRREMRQRARSRAGSPCPDPRRRSAPRCAWPRIESSCWRQRQRLAGGDAQLPLDEVEAGDHLGDRMLDLQPRVHLHEVEAAAPGRR